MHRTSTFGFGTQKQIYHSVKEWMHHNKEYDRMTQEKGFGAEKVIERSDRTRDRTKESVEKKKIETERKLDERIKAVDFVRRELERVRKSLQDELEVLGMLQTRIEDEFDYISKNAVEIIEKCIRLRIILTRAVVIQNLFHTHKLKDFLVGKGSSHEVIRSFRIKTQYKVMRNFREGRREMDKVHDEVKKELEKEKKMVEESKNILLKALEQTKEASRDLRASLYLLNKEVEEKLKCLAIETECLSLKETDSDLEVYRGNQVLDNGNITVTEWTFYSEEILKSTERKIHEARLFQPHLQNILQEIIFDLRAQFLVVNEAFQMRISEIKEAKAKLEDEHCEISRQVNNMTLNVAELEKSIQEKRGYLALAQTRLEKRSHRPTRELVRDEVEVSLVNEILEINNSVSQLQQMLSEAELCLRNLLKVQVKLEEEINIKTNSIKIDEVDCLTLRQGINYQPF